MRKMGTVNGKFVWKLAKEGGRGRIRGVLIFEVLQITATNCKRHSLN